MVDSISDTSPLPSDDAFNLPNNYMFLKVLGEGSYGTVLKCWEKDMKQTVAVKIPKITQFFHQEISMLRRLRCLNLDQQNIVKFFCCFHTSHGRALVFEMLDISLYDYMQKTDFAPMCLSDVSTIIAQLANALKALKSIAVIHTDIKLDNIMLVDHQTRPFRVKLIDFGLAIPTCKAMPGRHLQASFYRSPEIILGLPFSEAIDMWSLAIVMAILVHGDVLFPAESDYELLQCITKILGQPADHLLNNGLKTRLYFIRTEDSWRLKTEKEYYGPSTSSSPRSLMCNSLDDLKQLRPEPRNEEEAVEREQCIELLKAMLTLDESERISPIEVLTHPFITNGHHSSHPSSFPSTSGVNLVQPAAPESTAQTDKEESAVSSKTSVEKSRSSSTSIHVDHSPASSPTDVPSGVILVQPAAPENTLQIDEEESAVSSKTSVEKSRSSLTSIHLDHSPASSPTDVPSGVILVRPAAPENTLQIDEEESAVSSKTSVEKSRSSSTSHHPDHHSQASSPTDVPSGVILVRPAAPENTLQIDEEESAVSSKTSVEKSRSSSTSHHPDHHSQASSPTDVPSGVILVRPAAPENTLQIDKEESAVSSKESVEKSRSSSTSINVDHSPASSPTDLPSGVILVRPAAPKNTLQMEDEEHAVRLQAELKKTSSVNVTDSDMASLECDTSTQKKEKKKKKKKNCVRRFFSWMRKTFCCCCTINKDIEGDE